MHAEEEKVNPLHKELQQMGFPPEAVREALQLYPDKEQAANHLLQPEAEDNEEDFEDEEEDYKMIFVMRMDLKIPLGKMAELVATATLAAYQQIEQCIEKDELKEFAFFEWKESGQKKIVVKAQSEEEVRKIIKLMEQKNINCFPLYEKPSKLRESKQEPKPAKKKKEKKDKQQEKEEKKEQQQDEKEKHEIIKQQKTDHSNESDHKHQENGSSSLSQKVIPLAQIPPSEKKEQSQSQKEQQDSKPAQKSKRQEKKQKKQHYEQKQQQQQQQPVLEQPQQQILVLAACGPAAEGELNPLTGHLKLL